MRNGNGSALCIALCNKINLGSFGLGSAPEAPPGGWFLGLNPVPVATIYRVITAQYTKHYHCHYALPLRITITITIAITITESMRHCMKYYRSPLERYIILYGSYTKYEVPR